MTVQPKVLVVDDEERFRTNMVKLLGTKGLEAHSVDSGEQALTELAQKPYDVVLLDVRMPGLSGVGTLKHIREAGYPVAVIVVTGHASLDDAKDLLNMGAYDYLLKPAGIETIVQKIQGAFKTIKK